MLVQKYESLITTDGQSASLSWNKAPVWGLRTDFYFCQTVASLFIWDALSDERTGQSFRIAPSPRQLSHFRVRVPWDSWPYFTVSDSLFVTSYYSQGYDGGIRPRLHMGVTNMNYIILYLRNRNSAVVIATGYGLDDRRVGVRIPVESRILSSPRRPDWLWGTPRLISKGYRG
jgi:hypothetical protein